MELAVGRVARPGSLHMHRMFAHAPSAPVVARARRARDPRRRGSWHSAHACVSGRVQSAVLPLFPIPLVSRVQQRAARPRWLVAGA